MRERLRRAVAVPVITAGDVAMTVDLCKALVAGGLDMLEITLRTPSALAAVEAVAREVPEALVGVGTLLDARDAARARDAGARFAVSPGFTATLAEATFAARLDWLPGAVTPSEVMTAREAGFTTLKFFPAQQSGGAATLLAFAPVFGDVEFCPTGGINPTNARDYLGCANVAAIGGTWMMPKDAIASRDWRRIESLASDARRLRS
jgi:2-dehydro-3-deoxyphosphogluconate aldolase/(4S)-4-hydroxy-2-oxoglutarate aldolase